MAVSTSLYSGDTSISGGNVQFGDTNNYHQHSHYTQPRIDDDRTILAWLSNLNFGEVLRRHCNKRTSGTGKWLIEHPKYKSWHALEAGCGRVLWCKGHPGTGKTILCSMMVEHLRSTPAPDEAVVYCFFDYARRQELSVDMIFSEFMIQLASRLIPQVSAVIRNLYSTAEHGRRRPTLRELTVAFHQASALFRQVSVVVDALDECESGVRRQLLSALDLVYNHNMRVLIFSRPHIQLHTHLSKTDIQISEIEIQASTSDLHLFVNSRITEFEDLEFVIDSSDMTVQQIADIVVTKASFSFLAAEMRLNTIGFVLTAQDLTAALESGLSDPTALYSETLSRIRGQHVQKTELALRVLGWLSVVKQPLTIRELCHVLAIQPGKHVFSAGQMPAADIVINSCFGLVIRDSYTDQVRLLHYTLLEFIEQHGLAFIDHKTVIETCLTCLSAPELEQLVFKVPPTASRLAAMHMRILRTLPFTSYAANHWLDHMCADFESLEFLVTYLAISNKVVPWLRIMDFHNPKRLRRLFTRPIFGRDPGAESCSGVRVALALGWRTSFQQIVTRTDIGMADFGTMLTSALDKGSSELLEIFLAHGFDHSSTNDNGEGLIHQAVSYDFPTGISILAKYGADVDQRNFKGETPLQVSLRSGQEDCSATLLQYGASVDERDASGKTILSTALCSKASIDLVNVILSRNPSINSQNAMGETQLHQVLQYGDHDVTQESIVKTLLRQGADLEMSTADGHTVLHYACIWSSSPAIIDMILVKYTDDLERPPEEDIRGHLPDSPDASFSLTERQGLLEVIKRYANYHNRLTRLDCTRKVTKIVFESVLRRRANVNYFDVRSGSPLHWAVRSQREDVLDFLLRAGVDANYQDHDGKTALQLAFEVVHLDQRYAELLFDHTHNLCARDKSGNSMLDYAVMCPFSGMLVERLLPSFSTHDALMSNGNSFLGGAVAAGHSVTIIEKLLLHFPTQINSQDKHGNTPIALAASLDQRDIVILFLHHKADISIRNKSGFAAIHSLLIQYYPSELQITTGGDVCIQPQNIALLKEVRISTPIGGPTDIIHKLLEPHLLKHVANVNAKDFMGRRILHLIVASRYPLPVIKDIAAIVEDVKQCDSLGNSNLHFAISSILGCNTIHQQANCLVVSNYLLKELGANANLQNQNGETPLHLLIQHASTRNWLSDKAEGSIVRDLFDLLFRHQATPFIPACNGKSAISLTLDAWSLCQTPPTTDCLLGYFEKKMRVRAITWWHKSVEYLKCLTNHEIEVWSSILVNSAGGNSRSRLFLLELQREREQTPHCSGDFSPERQEPWEQAQQPELFPEFVGDFFTPVAGRIEVTPQSVEWTIDQSPTEST